VQDYIFKRYGKNHAALLGATSTFRDKSIIRELGKVFGLPKEEIDLLVNDPGNSYNNYDTANMIRTLGQEVLDFPNMRTIHAGGMLVTEEPITYFAALDMPPKGFLTTQWDMYIAEEMGFEKLDILSQRGIGHIKEAVEIIVDNGGKEIDIHQVDRFFADPKVRQQLKDGETIGCFYIESPAMRGLLKKLRCDNYISLVAASSIIRPGVAKSGMMREYIRRFHHPNDFTYLHPVLKEQLSETYGVMVFQEDVIKVAHHFAGLDLAEADVLRRAMSGKFRSLREFRLIEEKYFANCRELGRSDEVAAEVWRQIESFAGYSFSKAHSASYAVESFQSLYLKAHHPLEFMVAVINNFGGFYHTWVYFNEAQRQGATIELPCINRSLLHTRIIGTTIFMGFVHVQNLESTTIDPERTQMSRGVPLHPRIHRPGAGGQGAAGDPGPAGGLPHPGGQQMLPPVGVAALPAEGACPNPFGQHVPYRAQELRDACARLFPHRRRLRRDRAAGLSGYDEHVRPAPDQLPGGGDGTGSFAASRQENQDGGTDGHHQICQNLQKGDHALRNLHRPDRKLLRYGAFPRFAEELPLQGSGRLPDFGQGGGGVRLSLVRGGEDGKIAVQAQSERVRGSEK
jgi:Bacterial DNA polymerase III alpha subunit finger domain/Bacterial DNA polymerase III alpha NTPase domain